MFSLSIDILEFFFRCQRWKNVLGFIGNHRYATLTPEQSHNRIKICSLHFRADDIVNSRIHSYDVPSLRLPQDGSQKDDDAIAGTSKDFIYIDAQVQTDQLGSRDECSQTSAKLSSGTPRKVALRKKIVSLEKTVASTSKRALDETGITLDDVFKFLDRKYPEQYCKLLKAQLSLINKAPKGSRYSDEFKQFALTLYFLGPKAYKKFSTICRLPSKSTLHRFTKNWIVEPGFNDFIFRVIEFRIGLMKEKERYCILCLDEISLKSHLYYDISRDKIVGFQTSLNGTSTDIASSALTVMVRGLASNWKIPLAYFFYKTSATSDDLKDILFKTVRRCKSIGLNVMGVVSDQGSNFQKLVKTLNVTDENPIFLIDDHKLVYLFDIPHLLKSTRNNLFSYQFLLQGGETRKHYIETMYNYDRTKQYKLALKLNNDHIYRNNFQKMKVTLASQVPIKRYC
ncbi:uncharacterized protein [Leptinotarsa decemlineata]|uniref:uncharacterized protein n=1 Tax=Leptinotarsa decemlineata TaxID=7539 RepID=UPI003D30D2F3